MYHYTAASSPPHFDLARPQANLRFAAYLNHVCTYPPFYLFADLVGPCDRIGALPRNITGIAEVLRDGAGYATHFVGKWDAGMATPKHTPQGRGHESSLNYFSHGNWAYTQAEW